MEYNVQNKNSITKSFTLGNEIEYTNSLQGLASDDIIDKILKDIAVLQQEVITINGEISNMEVDVTKNAQDIAFAKQQISAINTRLGTIDLVLADLQAEMSKKADLTHVNSEVSRLDGRIDNIDVDIEWDDVLNKPAAFPPTKHAHSEYLPKTDVVNTTDETELGKALDATQNNKDIEGTLAKKIDYMYTHGYEESIRYDDKDEEFLNSLNENGKYTVSLIGVPNVVDGWYNIDVTMHTPTIHGNQILKGMGGNTTNRIYIRTRETNRWYDAQEIITAEPKVEITSAMLKNDWAIYKEDHSHHFKECSDKVELDVFLVAGTGTVIATGLPAVGGTHVITGVTDDSTNVRIRYSTTGEISLLSAVTAGKWVSINATVLK